MSGSGELLIGACPTCPFKLGHEGKRRRGRSASVYSSGTGQAGRGGAGSGCSVRGGIGLGGRAGLRLCGGGCGRGRGGEGRGGGLLLAVVVMVVGPPALPRSLGRALPPQVVVGQGLLHYRAVLPPVVQAELPQSLQQMSRRAATSLLTLLLSPRTGLR